MSTDDRGKFTFLEDWFRRHIPTWDRLFGHLKGKPLRVLEIGVWEGCSTTWILEELLTHPKSRLIAVDTFKGSPFTRVTSPYKEILPKLEKRFRANIKKTGQKGKVKVVRSTSLHLLSALHRKQTDPFDLIYIDGSHASLDVLSDASLAWPLLAPGGVIVFDDYGIEADSKEHDPKMAVDSFLQCVGSQAEVLHTGWQIAIKKKQTSRIAHANDPI